MLLPNGVTSTWHPGHAPPLPALIWGPCRATTPGQKAQRRSRPPLHPGQGTRQAACASKQRSGQAGGGSVPPHDHFLSRWSAHFFCLASALRRKKDMKRNVSLPRPVPPRHNPQFLFSTPPPPKGKPQGFPQVPPKLPAPQLLLGRQRAPRPHVPCTAAAVSPPGSAAAAVTCGGVGVGVGVTSPARFLLPFISGGKGTFYI